MNTEVPEMDWKQPLYECAAQRQRDGSPLSLRRAAEEFALLGGYRDSATRKKECETGFAEQYEEICRLIPASDSVPEVRDRIHTLHLFWGMPGYEEERKKAKEREEQLIRRDKRRKMFRVIRRTALALTVCAIIALIRFYNMSVVQPRILDEARTLAREERYEEAAEKYRKIRYERYSEEANEQIPALMKKAAYKKLEEGDYDGAHEIFVTYGEDEDLKYYHTARAEAYLAEREYELALGEYASAKDHSKDGKICSLWAAETADEGDYYRAVEIMEMAGEDKEYEEQRRALLRGRAEQAVREALGAETQTEGSGGAKGAGKEGRARAALAAEIGKKVDDLDGQLLYCRALYDAGYDLKAVYPDGVKIKGLTPSAYMPTADNKGLPDDLPLRVLPFCRKEVDSGGIERSKSVLYSYLRNSMFMTGEVPWSRKDESSFDMRLLPDVLFGLPEEFQAESGEDCTVYLVSDTFYMAEGTVMVNREKRKAWDTDRVPLLQEVSYYTLLSAVDNVTIYKKDEPDRYYIVDYRKEMPPVMDEFDKGSEYIKELRKRLAIAGQIEVPDGSAAEIGGVLAKCWGEPDPEFLKETMEKAVAMLQPEQ